MGPQTEWATEQHRQGSGSGEVASARTAGPGGAATGRGSSPGQGILSSDLAILSPRWAEARLCTG
jgi:hypothetical protein